jgi:single-stranded DNA-binding protein
MQLLGGKPEGQAAPRNASQPKPQQPAPAADFDSFDDDIPF